MRAPARPYTLTLWFCALLLAIRSRLLAATKSQLSLFAAFALLLALPMPAAAENPHRKGPKVDIAEDATPLAKKWQKKLDDDIEKIKKTKPQCDHKPKRSERALALDCGIPASDVISAPDPDCPDCGASNFDDHGKGESGRRIKGKMKVRYDMPAQAGMSGWPTPQFNKNRDKAEFESSNPDARDRDPMNLSDLVAMNVSKEEVLQPEDCLNFGASKGLPPGLGDLQPDGTCDVRRAFVVNANKHAKDTDAPPGKTKKKNKAFDADDQGNCADPATTLGSDAAVKCGEEARQQTITESIDIVCRAPFVYVDGQCAKAEDPNNPISAQVLAARTFAIPQLLNAQTTSVTKQAMMGFTFAPPEIRWGIFYEEEACIDLVFTDFCFTAFAARIGYDFDLGVGLRLPVELNISQVPSPSALAQQQFTLKPQLEPVDFTAAQYKQFCLNEGMADGVTIADCDRFSFPEFLSSELAAAFPNPPPPIPPTEIDGKELVAQAKLFAGIQVVVLEIPIIDLAIDGGADFATMCTLLKLKEAAGVGDLAHFGFDLVESRSLLHAWKTQSLNCTSFTTPFGTEPDPISGVLTKRVFPFGKSFQIGADCTKAKLEGKTVTIRGKERPICTGLQLKYKGASLGLGLEVQLLANSNRIDTDWSASGDASGNSNTVSFRSNNDGDIENPDIGPVTFDNYSNGTDFGTVNMNNFTFWINNLTVVLNANVEFGGILSVLPSLASIPIYALSIDGGDLNLGIPVPQHNRTGPVQVPVFVENYALSINGSPSTASDPTLIVNSKTLRIQPGKSGTFEVQGTNLGSVAGDIDNFNRLLPEAVVTPPLPIGWQADYQQHEILNIPAHSTSPQKVTLTVTPLRHPLTRPGTYPIVLAADSRQARNLSLADQDPSGQARRAAKDTVNVEIIPFYDPRLTLTPESSSGKPGAATQNYGVLGENFGNVTDTALLSKQFVDFNQAGCTLTTLGASSGCPYRAVPTVMPASAWTTIAALPAQFGPLQPTGSAQGAFGITVPADWAGMQDTTYELVIKSTSTADPAAPPASNAITVRQTVVATKQSMTRYIGLELEELAHQIRDANAAGIKTGGALNMLTNHVQKVNGRALELILAGNLSGASNTLASEINGFQGFLQTIKNVPPAALADWTARTNAILNDLTKAQASNVQ